MRAIDKFKAKPLEEKLKYLPSIKGVRQAISSLAAKDVYVVVKWSDSNAKVKDAEVTGTVARMGEWLLDVKPEEWEVIAIVSDRAEAKRLAKEI